MKQSNIEADRQAAKQAVKCFAVVLLLCWVSACSTLKISDDPGKHYTQDPLQGLNRKVYSFNRTADKLILRPVASGYKSALPAPARTAFSNFFANLNEPLNAVNNLLQGKLDRALSSAYRFTVNSTVGVFGLFDVAKHYDVQPAKEDFGQTLAAWGVRPGPFIMVPFAGPSSLRDAVGVAADRAILYPIDELSDSSRTRTGLFAMDVIETRANLLGADKLLESQLDPYAFLKQTYEQNRVKAIYDGKSPVKEIDDIDF